MRKGAVGRLNVTTNMYAHTYVVEPSSSGSRALAVLAFAVPSAHVVAVLTSLSRIDAQGAPPPEVKPTILLLTVMKFIKGPCGR